jgi:hypothetical protein
LFPFTEIHSIYCWSFNQTHKMKNVLCQLQTYITGLDHMSFVTGVIMNVKWKNKQLCCIICFLLILLMIYIIRKDRWKWIYPRVSKEPTYLSKSWNKCVLWIIPVNCTPDRLVVLRYWFHSAKGKISSLVLNCYVCNLRGKRKV